jgi:hypothetical protein
MSHQSELSVINKLQNTRKEILEMSDERKNDLNKELEDKGALRIDDDMLEQVSGGSLSEVVKEKTKDIDDDTADRV